jgi:outer membrane protein assembly factor BamB
MSKVLAALGLVLTAGLAEASDWPQFRGPGGTGVSADTGLPDRWGPTENLRWKAVLPGRGPSSPVVAGGRVYVTACSGAAGERLHVLCFDAATGKPLWERRFWASGETVCHPKTSMAAPTPVAASERVYALFASGDLFCLDKAGLLVWCRALGRDYPGVTNQIGMASSPVLAGEVLVVPLESPGESLVAGIDARTGRNRWKAERPKEPTWTTPLVWEREGRPEVLLQSGTKLTALDPRTGRERWAYADQELTRIPSPVAGPGLVLVAARDELLALRPGKGAAPERVWRSTRLKTTTATPLVYQGRVYVVNSAGVLSCAEASTGKQLWQERLQGPFSASPLAAGGKLYLVNEEGVTTVIRLGDKPRVLAVNALEDALLATPAVADGALFLRSDKYLFCVSGKKAR